MLKERLFKQILDQVIYKSEVERKLKENEEKLQKFLI
jgi:hypothetical protein